METQIFPVGKRVRITRPGPCFGMCGTIQCVSVFGDEGRNPMCWYLIGLQMREDPLWFKHSEVAPMDAAPFAVQAIWS